jgi:hypothetical protein
MHFPHDNQGTEATKCAPDQFCILDAENRTLKVDSFGPPKVLQSYVKSETEGSAPGLEVPTLLGLANS